jgi:hypothetical protein
MARYYGLWYGGHSYSAPEPDDLEEFSSLADARTQLIERYRYGDRRRMRFAFVTREPAEVFTPCVSDNCEIALYGSPDALDYPIRRAYLTPDGHAHIERC